MIKAKATTKKRIKQILIVLLILFILLSFRPVARVVANGVGTVLGKPSEWKKETEDWIVSKAVTPAIILAGILFLGVAAVATVTIVAVVAVVVGIGLLAWGAWRLFGPDDEEELPKGQKPDGVSLGGAM